MPTPRRKRDIKPVRALELLDGCGADGCTEGIMRAHGFAISDMVELVRARLATAECVVAGSRKIEIATLWTTDAGRRAPERT